MNTIPSVMKETLMDVTALGNRRLSARNRASHFEFLLDEEVMRMEDAMNTLPLMRHPFVRNRAWFRYEENREQWGYTPWLIPRPSRRLPFIVTE